MRKQSSIIITFLFLVSCNSFKEHRIVNRLDEYSKLITKLEKYGEGSYDRDDIDEFEIDDVRNLNIDYVIKNIENKNQSYSGFVEENDSLIILIEKSFWIAGKEKRLIHDYAKKPRNFGSEDIIGASYKIAQLNERFYYSEIGFD